MNMGHLGIDRTMQLIRERFYWPKMEEDVRYFINYLCPCVAQKKPHIQVKAPMLSIESSAPLELIGIDFLHLEKSSGGYEYILLITDHFTRYAQAYATRNKAAKTAANHLYNDFILRFGIPSKVLHDQGGEFENDLFKHLAKLLGIQDMRTPPYHPETNGQVERKNQTLLSMLRTLPEKYKSSWKDHLNKVLHAYNCTRNSTTGYSPYYLMFGRKPKLPIDILLQTEGDPPKGSHKEYLEKWKKEMGDAFEIALQKSTERKNKDAERKIPAWGTSKELEVNDHVLVKNLTPRGGPGKLRSFWEQDLSKVIEKHENGLTYKIQSVSEPIKTRVLHRNMLMPINHLLESIDTPPNISPMKTSKKKTKQKSESATKAKDETETSDSSDESDTEEIPLQFTPNQLSTLQQLTSNTQDNGKNETSEVTVESVPETKLHENENEQDQNVDFKVIPPDINKNSFEGKEQENKESKPSSSTTSTTRIKNSIEVKDLNTIIPENKEPPSEKFISTSSAIPQRVKKVIRVEDPTIITSQEQTNERNKRIKNIIEINNFNSGEEKSPEDTPGINQNDYNQLHDARFKPRIQKVLEIKDPPLICIQTEPHSYENFIDNTPVIEIDPVKYHTKVIPPNPNITRQSKIPLPKHRPATKSKNTTKRGKSSPHDGETLRGKSSPNDGKALGGKSSPQVATKGGKSRPQDGKGEGKSNPLYGKRERGEGTSKEYPLRNRKNKQQ